MLDGSSEKRVEAQEALKSGDLETLKKLFEGGLDPDEEYNLKVGTAVNALSYFCYETNPGVGRFFYSKPPYYIDTPLEFSISPTRYKEIIEYLVSKGVKVDNRDKFFHQTPLSTAIGFDNTPAALALIDLLKNQQPQLLNDYVPGNFTHTPLILSIHKANQLVFDALLESNLIDVNKVDEHGLTPLHWAVIMCLPEMVEKLIKAGANINAVTPQGKKPEDYIIISDEQLSPVFKEYNIGSKKIKIISGSSTQSKEFRPIMAHFNDDRAGFLEIRNKKLQDAEPQIRAMLSHIPEEKLHEQSKKGLFFGKDKQITQEIIREDDLELGLELSAHAARQRREDLQIREKNIQQQQYPKEEETLDINKMMGQIGGMLKGTIDQSRDGYINELVNRYSFPLLIAEFFVDKVVADEYEVSEEEKENLQSIHTKERTRFSNRN